MIVRDFLQWFCAAPVSERIEAAGFYCEAFAKRLPGIFDDPDSEAALTLILDDNAPSVRRVLADMMAGCEHAPRHIIVGLAQDHSEIAVPVLGRSLQLTDADLLDCLAVGDEAAQAAIALRGNISISLSAAIAEIGSLRAVSLLVRNPDAQVLAVSLARIAERFGHEADLRQSLLQRHDLPIAVRHSLVIRLSESLMDFVSSCGWSDRARAQRLIAEANERATILLATEAGPEQTLELVEALRTSGQLTPSLLLRALLSCNLSLFEAALCALTRLPIERVRGLVRDRAGASFAAIYRRAKMPAILESAFKAAFLGACAEYDARKERHEPRLSRSVIGRVLIVCAQEEARIGTKIMGLLRRLDTEAACEDARIVTAQLLAMPAPIAIMVEPADVTIDFAAIEQELEHFIGEQAINQPTLLEHAMAQLPEVEYIQPETLHDEEVCVEISDARKELAEIIRNEAEFEHYQLIDLNAQRLAA